MILIRCSRCKEWNLRVGDPGDADAEILQQGGCPKSVHPNNVDLCGACLAEEPAPVVEAVAKTRESHRYLRTA